VYLGSMVTHDTKADKEIKRRIGIAKTAYKKLERVLTSKSVSMTTRMRLLKCYVWSTLLYGCESWTISKQMEDRLRAAEMWFLRRMLKISWTDMIPNKVILKRFNTERQLISNILSRQIRFLGHVLRKEQLEEVALTGHFEGRRAPGRPRLKYLNWMERATGVKPLDLVKSLKNRREKEILTAAYARTLARHTD